MEKEKMINFLNGLLKKYSYKKDQAAIEAEEMFKEFGIEPQDDEERKEESRIAQEEIKKLKNMVNNEIFGIYEKSISSTVFMCIKADAGALADNDLHFKDAERKKIQLELYINCIFFDFVCSLEDK